MFEGSVGVFLEVLSLFYFVGLVVFSVVGMKIMEWGVTHFNSTTFDRVFTIFTIHYGMKYQLPAIWVNLVNQWWTCSSLHLRWSFWKNLCKSWERFSEPSSFGWISMVGLRCEGFHIQYCVVGKKILQPSHLQDRDDCVVIFLQGKQEDSWTHHRYIPYHIIHYITILFQSHSLGHALPWNPWQKNTWKGSDQVVPRDKQLDYSAGLAGRGNEYPLIHCSVSTMATG